MKLVNQRCAVCAHSDCEHEAWRVRMHAITEQMRANPHRTGRDYGSDGHFRNGVFIAHRDRKAVDLAMAST